MVKALMMGLVALAVLAALVYFLTGAGILQPGELQSDEASASIAYVAGACYVAGGLVFQLF